MTLLNLVMELEMEAELMDPLQENNITHATNTVYLLILKNHP